MANDSQYPTIPVEIWRVLTSDHLVTYCPSVDEVFKALADATRRSVLDALFERDGQTVQALCGRFPEMTRFGVMKHLAVLEAANLVSTRRVGRTKLHYLNPVPIGEIADRWVSKYAHPFTRAMVGLRNDIERGSA
jgi:DNA-binding transcriptional ArsR family regulator